MAIYRHITMAVVAGLIMAMGSVVMAADAKSSDANAKPEKSATAAASPGCLKQTGSRIPANGPCRASGHSYTRNDINRTGKPMTAGVLQRLDPTIRIRQ
jgi:hypothetical protein